VKKLSFISRSSPNVHKITTFGICAPAVLKSSKHRCSQLKTEALLICYHSFHGKRYVEPTRQCCYVCMIDRHSMRKAHFSFLHN